MSSKVYIGDLNKEDLIAALWSRSKPAAFFALSGLPAPPFDKEDALRQAEKSGWYFDYLQGRVIKSNLSGEEADPWGYDRDNGAGAFREVVEGVRNKSKGVAKDKVHSESATAVAANVTPATVTRVTVAASAPASGANTDAKADVSSAYGTSTARSPAATPANTIKRKSPKQPRSEPQTRIARFFCF